LTSSRILGKDQCFVGKLEGSVYLELRSFGGLVLREESSTADAQD
jgi:hypothetical protein